MPWQALLTPSPSSLVGLMEATSKSRDGNLKIGTEIQKAVRKLRFPSEVAESCPAFPIAGQLLQKRSGFVNFRLTFGNAARKL
jgi:hypothetical protein